MVPSQSILCDLGNKKKVNNHIPLPLVPFDHKAPARDECQKFTLKMVPTDANSANYKFQMRILKGSEDAHSILAWGTDDISHVINKLGMDQPIPAYTLYTLDTKRMGHK